MTTPVRDVLARALPEVTPLPTVDCDRLVATSRRAVRRRRTTRGFLGVAMVLLPVAGAATYTATAGGPSGVAPAVTGSPTPSPVQPIPATGRFDPPVPAPRLTSATASRLTTALQAAMHKTLPNSMFTADRQTSWPALEVRVYDGAYQAGAWVTDAMGSGNVAVVITPALPNAEPECSSNAAVGGQVSCEVGTGPGGEQWTFSVRDDRDNGRPQLIAYEVVVERPDATFIQITVENTVSVQLESASASRTTPPMTKEQLLAVAFDPAVRV